MKDHPPKHPPKPELASVGRRRFFRGSLRMALGGGAAAGMVYALMRAPMGKSPPQGSRGVWGICRPPGARDEEEFLGRCIRCTRCADSCVEDCIRYFGPEAGQAAGTPYVLPREKACSLCMECCGTCPTEALMPLKKKEEVVMGTAVVDKRLCVSHNGTGVCGACHTICPLKNRAITQGSRLRPTVHPEHCTGCGLCEEVCIVRTRRAIQVRTERLWPGVVRELTRNDEA